MKKVLPLLFLFSVIIAPQGFAQELPDTALLKQMLINYPMQDLKSSEISALNSLPLLKMPAHYLTNRQTLPVLVDNSLQPYFRPIGWQQGYECGQSAGIAYNFTYELCRLREVSAQLLENQLVTHFSWDFLNSGQQYVGASAFDGWEVVRAAGTPNSIDYGGGLATGGHTRWMSGYNLYYNAMHNRINTAYQIPVGTEEGLMILKQWIYDHLDGSAVGGVVNFYGGYFSPTEYLPAGTLDAGKAVKTSWSGSSHTWTICGYNDSIKWDYNSDGQYTNNIDINNDGLVNMKDWEIGGLKFANGYYSTGWGDQGFCYMMYKCLADASGSGGLWNNSVFALGIKENCDPQLTYKATITHTSRNMLKVKAGIALNTSASKPEYWLDFPIFNYQGGAFYMQGDTTQAAKTIEFGLDCTPLLSYITPGAQVKYFLDVYEQDPGGSNSGQVVNFSVIDYAGGMHESICASTNVPIINNDTTRLSVLKNVTFSKVAITTDSLSPANVNEPYSFQLSASGGSTPYRWDVDWTASESMNASAFPTTSAQQLVFLSANNGFATQNLSFDFPFCGETYNKIYVHPNGLLKFDNGLYTWPFIIDKELLFRQTKLIGAFIIDLAGVTAWYEGNANSATFRWSASVSGQSGTAVNVAIRLYPSGKIELLYGNITVNSGTKFLSGLSKGDNRNYQLTQVSGAFNSNTTPFCISLEPQAFPAGFTLSEEGLITGTTSIELSNAPLKFRVTDNNNIWSGKSVPFSTQGVLMEYTILSGTDTIVQAGETAVLTIKLKNIGDHLVSNAVLHIHEQDSVTSMVDSTEFAGSIAAGDSVILTDAISFLVDPAAEGGHIIVLDAAVITPGDTFNNQMRIAVHSNILDAGAATVADGNNNVLEPGESAALIIDLSNIGGATATDIHVHLSCADPYISVTAADATIDSLTLGQSENMFFLISASSALPNQRIIIFNLDITASNNYHNHDFVVLIIGTMGETFESGDFSAYPWALSGNTPWFVQDTMVYMGSHASKSGKITHSQSSVMTVNANVLAEGEIRFVRKVSCEQDATNHNWDYLAFYIDGLELKRWDGNQDWAEEVFPVTMGNHTFNWSYIKDNSVSTGLDAALLDNIIFPAVGDGNPDLLIAPLSLYQDVYINSTDTQAISLTNNGSGLIIYNTDLDYINSFGGIDWCKPEYYAGNLDAGDSRALNVLFDANGLPLGTYNGMMTIGSNFISEVTIPVTMNVIPYSGLEENALAQSFLAYPNPFYEQTTFQFYHEGGPLEMIVTDIQGRILTKLLHHTELSPGTYTLVWDGMTIDGSRVSAGVYFCHISSGSEVKSLKIIHLD